MTIYLERHYPQKNMARYYRLIVAQTLFEEWALIAERGRIGSLGRVQQHWFDSRQEAETVQALRAQKKVRRGYY
jgi:predicted DNA-binding WGR domain protein